VVVVRWKFDAVHFLPQGAQFRNEGILKGRLIHADLFHGNARSVHFFLDGSLGFFRIGHKHVNAIAEPLYINYFPARPRILGKNALSLADVRRAQLQPLRVEARLQFRRCSNLLDFTLVHQRYPMAPLGFVQVRVANTIVKPPAAR